MRRILLLITDLEIGGTPTVVRELATRLRRPPEVHVEVACLKGPGPVADQLTQAGISVTAFGAGWSWQLPETIGALRRLVREHQIDTVFSFLAHSNVVAAIAARRLEGVRFFQSIQTTQYWPRWHWRAQAIAQRSAERIVVPSRAVAEMAQKKCGVESSRISIIPNAIDPADFPRVEIFKEQIIRVGFIGRLDRVKFLPELVMAMRLLHDRPEIQCHIFGYGPESRTVEMLALKYDLASRIFLRGPVGKPQEALAEIDMLVLPTPYEGFGLVLIEAMAAGVPVIASCRGGAADVVQDGINGLTVGRGAYDRDIAAAIRRIADEPALRDQLLANGLRTVQDKFNWGVVLPQYRKLLAAE